MKELETFKTSAPRLILENWYVLVLPAFFITYIVQLLLPFKFSNKVNTRFDKSNVRFECNKDRNISIEIYLTPCTSDAENEPEETRVAPFPKGYGTILSIVLTSRETSCFVSTARDIRKFKVSKWIYLRSSHCIEMRYCKIFKIQSPIGPRDKRKYYCDNK